MKKYRVTREGCVTERVKSNHPPYYYDAPLYEPLPGIPAKEISKVLNEFDAKGQELDWDGVEKMLIERGIIKD